MPNDKMSGKYLEREPDAERMCRIGHKILVLSGKDRIGKSTVAVNLAMALALAGKRVGLLDVNIRGSSVPKLLNLEGHSVEIENETLIPVRIGDGLKVMSAGFLLKKDDDAVVWHGPMKTRVIKWFLREVDWGVLDYLVIDSPSETGDETHFVCRLLEDADGAIVVTTPQAADIGDARRCINFSRALGLPVLGVIENMRGFVCPDCSRITDIFRNRKVECMAYQMDAPFLGRIPIDPELIDACDTGKPYMYHYGRTEIARAFENIIRPILSSSRYGS